ARYGRGVEQRAEQRALAGAVRPEDADPIGSPQRQMDVVQEVACTGPDDRGIDAEYDRGRGACLLHLELPPEPALEVVLRRLCPDPLERMVDQADLPRPRLLGRAPPRRLERAAGSAVVGSLHTLAGPHPGGRPRTLLERVCEAPFEPVRLRTDGAIGLLLAALLRLPEIACHVVASGPRAQHAAREAQRRAGERVQEP